MRWSAGVASLVFVSAAIVAGCMNKVVAHKLGISHKTVELHRSRIMTKVQAVSLPHLLRMALTGDVTRAS